VLGTLLTIYSICKIFYTAKNLRATSSYNVRFKNTTFLYHSILLAFNCVAELLSYIYGRGDFSPYSESFAPTIANFVILALDMTVQLFIVHICVNLGAEDFLSRYTCYLVDDGQGGFVFRFVPKESVAKAIDSSFFSDQRTELTESGRSQ
jgi:hypothetical protein